MKKSIKLNGILNVIKKNYHILIYGNPELIFNDLKNKFPLETVNKIEKLYIEFKSKYSSYLN